MQTRDRRTAGLLVVVAMTLFLVAASTLQRVAEAADAADEAQSSAEAASSAAGEVSDRVDDLESHLDN